jgi:hypothetical protein
MSTPNLEAKIALAWETFADYSNNEEKTDSEVIEQEVINDAEMMLSSGADLRKQPGVLQSSSRQAGGVDPVTDGSLLPDINQLWAIPFRAMGRVFHDPGTAIQGVRCGCGSFATPTGTAERSGSSHRPSTSHGRQLHGQIPIGSTRHFRPSTSGVPVPPIQVKPWA